MASYNMLNEFEMTDGRILTCEYVLHRRMKNKLDAERILYETKRKEYEEATANANTWRNVL